MSQPRVGCGAAVVRDAKLLLVHRLTEPEAGRWGLPGGKVDPFESAWAQAVRREIQEELGILIEDAALLCVVELIDRAGDEHWVAPVYRVASLQRRTAEPRAREACRLRLVHARRPARRPHQSRRAQAAVAL